MEAEDQRRDSVSKTGGVTETISWASARISTTRNLKGRKKARKEIGGIAL